VVHVHLEPVKGASTQRKAKYVLQSLEQIETNINLGARNKPLDTLIGTLRKSDWQEIGSCGSLNQKPKLYSPAICYFHLKIIHSILLALFNNKIIASGRLVTEFVFAHFFITSAYESLHTGE
jgi:hypothetical protein